MKKLLGKDIIALSLSAVMAGSSAAFAVPADPRPKKFTQPDGSTVTVKIRGDERNHYYLTEDDYLLVREHDAFYYGNVDANGAIVRSDILAAPADKRAPQARQYLSGVDMPKVYTALKERAESRPAPRRAPAAASSGSDALPGLFEGVHFPAIGNQKVLVVLVEYKDVKFKLDDPHDYFSRMLMEDGFSDYGGTGSCHDYFKDNSCGQFDPQFDLYGPLTLDHNMSYYGGNDWWGNDQKAYEMAIEACQQLDETVDFAEYDRDGNGYIDNIYIFYAGRGEATGGSSDTVWPHSWDISSATDQKYYFDGVQLERYGCSNEWEGSKPDGIGTFVHEFSHVLGLPDLYATSYTSAFTPGAWSILDYGPYNNDGCTPPNYGAFERAALGWMTPTVLDGPASVTLENITSNNAFMIKTSSKNEFFLFENRQQLGWDTYIPGHGMLVWHVDYNAGVWGGNRVNNESSHQYVDIEEADDSQTEGSRAGDAFPGTAKVTSFTDDTHPSMRTWGKKRLEMPITDITESFGVISFDVCGGYIELDPVALNEPTNVTGASFDISWSESDNATEYLVSVYTKDTVDGSDVKLYADGWCGRNVGMTNSVTITGLLPLTEYYCVVCASHRGFLSDESNEVMITTGQPTIQQIVPTATEASDINNDAFVANWQAVDKADRYYLTVYTKGDYMIDNDSCDFTGGISKMPAGWSTDSRLTYANEAYSGAAAPSLRLATADAYVSTPLYDADVLSMSFWMRGSAIDPANTISVYGFDDDHSQLLGEFDIPTEVPGQTITIDEMPAGIRGIRIVYHEASHKGSVAIDDIHIVWNYHQPMVALDGFNPYEAGGALSCLVYGLDPLTTYYYSVVASDGQLWSPKSNEVEVTTAAEAGVNDVTVAQAITVKANKINVVATPNTPITVYDIAGRIVAQSSTGISGRCEMRPIPSGLYMVRCGDHVSKIIIK